MTSLVVSIPTLGRPVRCVETARSARATVPDARIVFSCSPGDEETIEACRATSEEVVVVAWEQPCRADWARKHNSVYEAMREDWILLAGDDLLFHDGWFEACLRAAARRAGGACVVGTNDLGNRRVLAGVHSTHPLVHRDYIACGGVVDDPTRLLPEVYGHWFVDDEFVGTAFARGTYQHAHDALVEHLHPAWGKAVDDETYRLGQVTMREDSVLFEERRSLWDPRRMPRRGVRS